MSRVLWGAVYVALVLWRVELVTVVIWLMLIRGSLRDPYHTGAIYPGETPSPWSPWWRAPRSPAPIPSPFSAAMAR